MKILQSLECQKENREKSPEYREIELLLVDNALYLIRGLPL